MRVDQAINRTASSFGEKRMLSSRLVSELVCNCCSEYTLGMTGPGNGRATVAHVCDGLLVRVVYHYYNSSEYKQTNTSRKNPRVTTDQGQWIPNKLTGDNGESKPVSTSISTKQ